MQVRVFMVPVKQAGPLETEMNAFLRGHRVLSLRKEFVADGDNSYWAFCAEYLDGPVPAGSGEMGAKGPKVDYREVLKPEEFKLFSRLRDWRRVVAERDGVPVYTVFTNEQLAQVAQKGAKSLAALREVDGVGDARIEKYGQALLGIVNEGEKPNGAGGTKAGGQPPGAPR
jgi:superfamily II DNA helicase RecQ